ncbi:glutaredoxin family protein [Pedosphaera parvula]|uniref:Glutaredoxin n=1 Tax=Pedosphaera parvula (strain Ellin514) TaxID=320771 RepID=B9XM88_PEDPL|nr:glutaredoxin [Pedosphaera parvula Ellin514]
MAVNEKKIRLFIKPYCGWCHKATKWLDDHDVEYEVVDVIANDDAFDEMVKLSGQELAPVIDVHGRILADFGPDELARFWKKLEQGNA